MKRLIGILSIVFLSSLAIESYSQQLVSVSPDTVYQGTSVWLQITGTQTHFTDITTANQIELRRGFGRNYPDSFVVQNDSNLKALFSIGNLATGSYEIRVTTNTDGMMRLRNSVTVAPNPNAPAILALTPDTVMAGNSFMLTITAKNSHFLTGANLTSYLVRGWGQNYQSDSAKAISQTQMQAWFNFPYSVTTGQYELRVQNDSDGLFTLDNALTVIPNPNSPSLLAVNPNQVGQGETVTLTVSGKSTHFADPNGVLAMLTGNQTQLNPDSTKSVSDTVFYAYYNIPLSATLGFYTLQVIDQPDGQLTLNNAVEIIKSANSPDLVSVSPRFGYAGDTLVLSVSTKNTTLTQSAALSFRLSQGFRRLNPDSIQIVNDTTLKAYYVLGLNTTLGFYTANVTGAPEGNLSLANAFEVKQSPFAPQIVMLQPDSTIQGTSVQVSFLCKNTSFLSESGLTTTLRQNFFNSINADSTVVVNDTVVLGYFTIPMNAATGLYEARINNFSTGMLSLAGAFEIFASPYHPRIDKFNPLYASQGDQFTLKIQGKFTNFTQGTNQGVNLRMGWQSNFNGTNINVINDTLIEADFDIPADAAPGFYNLTVSGLDAGNLTLNQSFEIKLAPTSPQIVFVIPNEGRQGDQVEVMIYCANTTLSKDNNLTVRISRGWGQNINATSFTVVNDTLVKAVFDIQQNAQPGLYNVEVRNTSAGNLILNQGFEIKPPLTAAQLVSVTPASGKPGVAFQLTIKAINTHFTSGANTVQFSVFGQNYAPSSVTVVNDTLLTCIMTFPMNARLGLYSVNVNNQTDGQLGLQQAFQLLNYTLNPHIKSISADTLFAGNSYNLGIETGQTKLRKADALSIWIQKGTTIQMADSFIVNHDSSLNAYFTIDAKLSPGEYDLYVFTDVDDTMKSGSNLVVVDTSTSIEEQVVLPFKLYPNPVSSVMQIELGELNTSTVHLAVYDPMGRMVYQDKVEKSGFVISLNVSELPSGTYFMVIENKTQKGVQQFIKR